MRSQSSANFEVQKCEQPSYRGLVSKRVEKPYATLMLSAMRRLCGAYATGVCGEGMRVVMRRGYAGSLFGLGTRKAGEKNNAVGFPTMRRSFSSYSRSKWGREGVCSARSWRMWTRKTHRPHTPQTCENAKKTHSWPRWTRNTHRVAYP